MTSLVYGQKVAEFALLLSSLTVDTTFLVFKTWHVYTYSHNNHIKEKEHPHIKDEKVETQKGLTSWSKSQLLSGGIGIQTRAVQHQSLGS